MAHCHPSTDGGWTEKQRAWGYVVFPLCASESRLAAANFFRSLFVRENRPTTSAIKRISRRMQQAGERRQPASATGQGPSLAACSRAMVS